MPCKPLNNKPMTGAERVRKHRQERAKPGVTEVRGIWLPAKYHALVKQWAKNLKA